MGSYQQDGRCQGGGGEDGGRGESSISCDGCKHFSGDSHIFTPAPGRGRPDGLGAGGADPKEGLPRLLPAPEPPPTLPATEPAPPPPLPKKLPPETAAGAGNAAPDGGARGRAAGLAAAEEVVARGAGAASAWLPPPPAVASRSSLGGRCGREARMRLKRPSSSMILVPFSSAW